jgi:hypothetical protein
MGEQTWEDNEFHFSPEISQFAPNALEWPIGTAAK